MVTRTTATTLRIADNTARSKREFGRIRNLTQRIADRSLGQLEREGVFVFPDHLGDSNALTADQTVLQSGDDEYRTTNVMGYIGIGDERLIIESRFCDEGNDFFLQYLLSKVMGYPDLVDLKTDASLDLTLFNWLVFLFPHYLREALRKGPYKTYVRQDFNDRNVRGAIDVARHIRENVPFLGNVSYSQRQFTLDNPLMELVRHTIEYLQRCPQGRSALLRAREEVAAVKAATPSYRLRDRWNVILGNKRNALRHSYFREYRALQSLCLLILQHQSHGVGFGTQRMYGILFDGAWLWEEYMNTLMHEDFHHPMNKGRTGSQWLFTEVQTNELTGLIYPDFISRSDDPRTVADAKYKPIGHIHGGDYLQILAYMFRFDAKSGYFLYPESDPTVLKERFHLNEGTSFDGDVRPREDVNVMKMGLSIPCDCADYEMFANQMLRSEVDFRNGLRTISLANRLRCDAADEA